MIRDDFCRTAAPESLCSRSPIEMQAAPDDPSSFPFVLLGNKCDEPSDKRMVSERDARAWCEAQSNMPYLETSAKNDTNVAQAFSLIVSLALSSRADEPPLAAGAENLDFSEGARPPPKASCC
jgi:GTPase SAR1 family protein